MGRVFALTLEGSVYSCKYCGTHLAHNDDVVEEHILDTRRAYLFSKVTNVTLGEEEEKTLPTGPYIVASIFCVRCGSYVGWKYRAVQEESEEFRERDSVLKRSKIDVPDSVRLMYQTVTLKLHR